MPAEPRHSDSFASTVAVLFSIAALLIATLCMVVVASQGQDTVASAPPNAPIPVALSEYKITPAAITANTGDILLQVTNAGTMPHNLAVAELNAKTADLAPGGSATLTLSNVAAGTYEVSCTIPGHADLGMKATLTVGAGGGTATAAVASSASAAPSDGGTTAPTTAAPNSASTVAAGTQLASGPESVDVTISDSGVHGSTPMSGTVVPSPASVSGGDITFVVKNTGTVPHELVVLKTDTPFDKLPVSDSGDPPAPVTTGADKVDEGPSVGETGDPNLAAGETRTFTIKNMTPGNYVLVCNLAGHYAMGMRAAFTVT
jgi:uncharacterized cupredoxin-like copper-binding protein